jgi:hypothetical protein
MARKQLIRLGPKDQDARPQEGLWEEIKIGQEKKVGIVEPAVEFRFWPIITRRTGVCHASALALKSQYYPWYSQVMPFSLLQADFG